MDHEPHEPHEPQPRLARVLHADEVFRIQAAIFEVNRQLGAGFLEAIYQEAMEIELSDRAVPFVAAPRLGVEYKGRLLKQTYSPDLICFDKVVVELKAVSELVAEHRAQVINYLKPTGLRVGLLVNFRCAPKARIERFVL